ncbi:MAG: hypothetical protein GXP31_10520 [Kiritimatiellaeota bacterium]|nr:hypothetical protein [Kiritimatiellota bacterium]
MSRSAPTRFRRLEYRLEYLALRLTETCAGILPRSLFLRLGAGLGELVYRVGCYRKIVRRNMEFVGGWSPEEQARITRRLYRTLGRYAFDALRPSHLPPPFGIENEDVLTTETSAGKRGAVGILAHLGNWELFGPLFADRFPSLTVVGKPMKNPYVNDWLFSRRGVSGARVIFPRQAARKALKALKERGIVAFLIDQYAGDMGTSCPFLGHETRTVRTAAGLMVKTGCGGIGAYALLGPDNRYRIVFESAGPDSLIAPDVPDPVAALQAAHNEMLGRWIRENPDHWFGWFHRRFKDCIKY